MSEQTPSQAEGDRDDERNTTDGTSPPHPTPSQAEGDRDDAGDTEDDTGEPGTDS